MKAVAFDGIARELGDISTRRSFFRLLGGAATVGAGLALTIGEQTLAKGKNRGPSRNQGQITTQGKGKKITICYQNQTRTVKKKAYQTRFPGATLGPCSAGPIQPAACTTWIISGGPNQGDPILIDDDGSILNVTTGAFLVIDNNGQAGPINPVVFNGKVGDVLRVRATDWGGCRSFSPLWVHCLATGQKKQLFTGYSGSGCSNPKGDFLDMTLTLSL